MRAHPEYALILAVVGIFLAVGVPSLHAGRTVMGAIFVTLAVLVCGWIAVALVRERHV